MKTYDESEIVQYLVESLKLDLRTFVTPSRRGIVMAQVCAKLVSDESRSTSSLGTKMEIPK